jgi:hypothetical protein
LSPCIPELTDQKSSPPPADVNVYIPVSMN